MSDDFYYEDSCPPVKRWPVPLWLHLVFTLLAVVLWIAFAIWADLGAVVGMIGVLALLLLRRLDWFGL